MEVPRNMALPAPILTLTEPPPRADTTKVAPVEKPDLPALDRQRETYVADIVKARVADTDPTPTEQTDRRLRPYGIPMLPSDEAQTPLSALKDPADR